jgi:hypothetical protein
MMVAVHFFNLLKGATFNKEVFYVPNFTAAIKQLLRLPARRQVALLYV